MSREGGLALLLLLVAACHPAISVSPPEDPVWENEPLRSPGFTVNKEKPFNAERAPEELVKDFITPNNLFFVRSHHPTPNIDAFNYQLFIEGKGVKPSILSLADLKTFPKHEVMATLQCSGNRRQEMKEIAPLEGVTWGGAAIGNAMWAGARLRDVLTFAEFDPDQSPTVAHVQFEGLDVDPNETPDRAPYGASIPIEKAMNPYGDVLLAYEMNGKNLSRDHGYPVRVIVPGTTGARNVKWLGRIIVSEVESPKFYQQKDYKAYNPSTNWREANSDLAEAIQEMPVTSFICLPTTNSTVRPGQLEVTGYAWSGGGRRIQRVDLTADQGKSWISAGELQQDTVRPPRHWGWTLWKATVEIPEGVTEVEVWSKAVDSSYNTQPDNIRNIWNGRGVLVNSFSKRTLLVKQ